jgi:hypothetical protein
MSTEPKAILNHKALNGWGLFWLVSLPISVIIVIAMRGVDLSTGAGVSEMIGFSVRLAIPFINLVVAASAIGILFSGPFPEWWLRNRRYIGLCFAVAMAWQGTFIAVMSLFFRDYYYEDVYYLRDEIEGSVGYIFLTAMFASTFVFNRKHLNPQQWKVIHKSGLYFLWAYAFSVYWWNLHYYENPELIDYVFYWSGFVAFALRIAAWGKNRLQAARKNAPGSNVPLAFKILGGALITFGLVVAASGLSWQKAITAFLTAPQWSANLELWLPYWPFEPYLSLFIIGLGTLLVTRIRDQ